MNKFNIGETAILNEYAKNGLPMKIGERCVIEFNKDTFNSPNYDYIVVFDDTTTAPVRESELNKLSESDKVIMGFIFTGNKVIHMFDSIVKILKCDYINDKVEVEFNDGSTDVVDFNKLKQINDDTLPVIEFPIKETSEKQGYFAKLGLQVGKLVDEKQKAYGDSVTKCYQIMKILLQDYKNEDNTYTIPESLLPQMLLDVRKIDKMNRRFTNPDGDLMGENPFQDDVGYSMLGVRLVEQLVNAAK